MKEKSLLDSKRNNIRTQHPNYVGRGSGGKGWLLAISTGMRSHGPIYICTRY
jgi:hypothetical protein